MATEPAPHHTRTWYHPRAVLQSIVVRPRLYLAVAAAILTVLVLPKAYSLSVREAAAWVIGGLVYLTVAVKTMRACTPDVMARNAARQDDSRLVIMALILIAISSSFASIVGLLAEAKAASQNAKWLYLALAAATIIIAWSVTQVVFTLHYAHEFYRPTRASGDARGGLDFPGEKNPDYWDFLYFATSIGATSQTSDVAVHGRHLRRLVTVHAVVSFFFNAAVLALMINLAASLI